MPVEFSLAEEVTVVIAADELPAPVFVDTTGRRGRRMRNAFRVLGTATLVYAGLVTASLVGGPLTPQQLLPFPDLADRPEASAAPAVAPANAGAVRVAGDRKPAPTTHPAGATPPPTPAVTASAAPPVPVPTTSAPASPAPTTAAPTDGPIDPGPSSAPSPSPTEDAPVPGPIDLPSLG